MSAPVTVKQADRDAAATVYKALLRSTDTRAINARLGNMDDLDTVQAFARHRLATEAAFRAERAELVAALDLAEDALRNHACQVSGIPCRRSTEQCRTDCGQMAGEALDAVILARAKASSAEGV